MIAHAVRTAALLAALLCALGLRAEAGEAASRSEAVRAFVEEMSSKHGFDRAELERAFSEIRSRPRIVELMDRARKPTPWREYRDRFVNEEKLEAGARFWSEHGPALALASERYGVPEEIVVAILGIETHYGRHTGRFKVLEALATLAFEYPRRAKTFRVELEHFLLLAREESLPLVEPLGSYAGAMGIAQFMPGSYRRYAIDFDGDGKRNLFDDAADAIGSVANYLTAHGWQRGGHIAVQAVVPPEGIEPFESSGLSSRYRLDELKTLGVEAHGVFETSERVIPIELESPGAVEHWLGFDNFYVITRYNRSVYYAMAVFQLASELRAARGEELPAAADR